MSAQIMDSVIIENNTYRITEVSAPGMMFKPSEYGLRPNMRCTACFRGHWCDYQIKDSNLFLKDFYMYNEAQKYPTLNGVDVLCEEVASGKTKSESEKMGHKKYEDVFLFMPYTGKMLVGEEKVFDFYVNEGRQKCWAYKKLIECTFEDGKLISLIDYSCLAEKLREYIRNEDLSGKYTSYEEIPETYWGNLKWVLK